MKTNRFQFHVLVLPEDNADRQIANGFIKYRNVNVNQHRIQVMKELSGWENVVAKFNKNYASDMRNKFLERRVILLIDFDEDTNRLAYVKRQIPEDLENRVFVLGAWSEPERLKAELKKTFEGIGEALAQDCSDNQQTFWNHELLRHNHPELERLRSSVRPFLFE